MRRSTCGCPSFSNQLGVAVGVLALQVVQQAPPLADQLQQARAANDGP